MKKFAQHVTWLACGLLLSLLATGCGGQLIDAPVDENPGSTADTRTTVIRDTSGRALGVLVSWPQLIGVESYRLYRSDAPIPDSEVGNSALWVSPDPIPQPSVGGTVNVDYEDLFDVEIGQTWFYRVSSLRSGDESVLSPESEITIASFSITRLVNPGAAPEETLEIEGEHFGRQDPTDQVHIPGVVWTPGVGFEPMMYEAVIEEWTDTLLRVAVPLGATTGAVTVTIDGVTLDAPDTYTNSHPFITSLQPITGTVEDVLTVQGQNFGPLQDGSHRLIIEGVALLPGDYVSWSDSLMEFHPPYRGEMDHIFPLWVLVGVDRSNQGLPTLTNAVPTAMITADPGSGDNPLLVSFDGSGSSDPEDTDLEYDWDFGEGGGFVNTGTVAAVDHTYLDAGVYTAILRVTDEHGGQDLDSVQINVTQSNQPPTAVISATPNSGQAPLPVNFDGGQSSDPDGTITYEWNFGEGGGFVSSGDVSTIDHTYANPGTYTATLRVTDEFDEFDEDTIDIEVTGVTDPALISNNGSSTPDEYSQDDVELTARYTIAGGQGPYTIEWYLRDNNVPPNETLIATDTGLSAGDDEHAFPIDSTEDQPEVGGNFIPRGVWKLRAKLVDSSGANDPDGELILPQGAAGPGTWDVIRYRVAVVRDAEGDNDFVQSNFLESVLVSQGYAVDVISADLSLGDLAEYPAAIWASDGRVGANSPFEWLGGGDLRVLKDYVDDGGHALIFSPPASSTNTPFPQEIDFNDNYQPFATVNAVNVDALVMDIQDFASDEVFQINTGSLGTSEIGHDVGLPLLGGSVLADYVGPEGLKERTMAVRKPAANSGNVMLAMLKFSDVAASEPGTPAQLLDNIVAGTINWPGES